MDRSTAKDLVHVAMVPMCHRSVFWDNSHDGGPIEVAAFRYGIADYPPRWPEWIDPIVPALG